MLGQTGVQVTGRGPLAVVVTVAVAWVYYAVTLHLAATFFLGDEPSQRAATAGIAPAVVSVLLGRYGLAETSLVTPGVDLLVAAGATLFADALAIRYAYDLEGVPTVALTALHFAFATVLGVTLANLFGLT